MFSIGPLRFQSCHAISAIFGHNIDIYYPGVVRGIIIITTVIVENFDG